MYSYLILKDTIDYTIFTKAIVKICSVFSNIQIKEMSINEFDELCQHLFYKGKGITVCRNQNSDYSYIISEIDLSPIFEDGDIKNMNPIFSKDQIAFLECLGLHLDFNHPETISDDGWCDLENAVAKELQNKGFDEHYDPTETGLMCESILDMIP